MFVDRFMSTAMHYPCNYGYIPHTLSEDGDPVDVLVVTPIPLITGVVVRCRPIGMLKMTDEAGVDAKLLAVPVDKLCGIYKGVTSRKICRPCCWRRSPIFSSTTRISKTANGSRSRAGSASTTRAPRSSPASSATATPRTSRRSE